MNNATAAADAAKDGRRLLLSTMHPAWVQSQATREFVAILTKEKESVLRSLQQLSISSTSQDVALRILGVRLKEINNTLEIIYDVNKFVEKATL